MIRENRVLKIFFEIPQNTTVGMVELKGISNRKKEKKKKKARSLCGEILVVAFV